ncbi:MAG: hypothetical protein V8S27_05670 [Lachnospiraceae bacterium]
MLRVRSPLRGNERVIDAQIADPGTCGEENQQVEDGSPAKAKPEQAGGQKWGCKCADCKATMKNIQVACRLFYDLIDCQIVDDGDGTARQTDAEDQREHCRERRRRENRKRVIGIVNDNEMETRSPKRAVIAGKTKLARKPPIAMKDRRPPAVAKFMLDSAIREGTIAPKERMTIPLTKYP